MKKPSFSEKMKYRYEQFLGKGGVAVFLSLFVMFIVGFLFVCLLRWIVGADAAMAEKSEGFWESVWRTFMEMIDAGTLAEATDNSWWIRVIATISVLIGLVIFSMLVAMLTTALDTTLANFRKGRGKVWESNHTLILGWNERVIDIIKEVVIANESQKEASVVVLADFDKEVMDDEIDSKIEDLKTTKVITSPGYPASLAELKRVQAANAKSVIILASCTESASQDDKDNSDNLVIKEIMAILAVQNNVSNIPIIAEIFSQDKRELVKYFNDSNIVTLDSWNIMGKLLVQTSLTGGLEIVYNELFGFDGSEMYFYKANWGEMAFYDLVYHFADGVPIGIHKSDGQLIIRPPKNTLMQADDEIIILSQDDSTINFSFEPVAKAHELSPSDKKIEKKIKRILVLGWHDISRIFIRESNDYLKEGSSFDIMFDEPETMQADLEILRAEVPDLQINMIAGDPMSLKDLETANAFSYDNILILSQDSGEQEPEKVDSDTLMILLLLRKLKRDTNPDAPTKILTQILNSENQELIHQTDVDDFIISNKMITKILAQLSEQPRIKLVYDELFKADGSEIYVKGMELYTDLSETPNISATFADLIAAANRRKEICIGVRVSRLSNSAADNFGVILNPPKDKVFELSANDSLVVISENEQ
jgi:hypothetical protein